MRTRARWLGPIAALGLVVAAMMAPIGPANAESNGGVRVMPLGDSITEGTQTPGGYRIGLWQRLANAGHTVDFVGSQSNGPASLGDRDHEGHPGWRIDQIDANIVNWLNTSQPDTVLLHIGTNDMLKDGEATAPDRLSTLIDRITTTAPNAEVFVAQIIPLGWGDGDAAVKTYNAAIPGIVQSKVNAGKNVHLVDMHSALTAADLEDGVHPTAGGYDKMATVWYDALQSVPGSVGSASSNAEYVGVHSGRCLEVAGLGTANGTDVQLWDCWGGSNQRWAYTASKQLVVYGNKCLDAHGHGTSNGTKVVIWDCSGHANQQWNVNADGTITGVQSGLCLDASGWGTNNGTKVHLWTCGGHANQQWTRR
ncbi:RICIN domain-containing protein [Isoptericola croceus]|uniref:RICIN domain-containing protein n=1 Tax=Isoptericola croceus TaxID=3031406 RepID=UPI0023F86282|nr:RICIN domain-containing protein [Isoptericola croceus]